MWKRLGYLAAAMILAILGLCVGVNVLSLGTKADVPPDNPDPIGQQPILSVQSQSVNLLVNGSMEEGFYWRYPNHFVANGWGRWWIGDPIPEYDDAREWRPDRYDGAHAQIYFWISPQAYTAGIYQRVEVTPCTFYQFEVYGRNTSVPETDHHARAGIDPLGRACSPYMSSLPEDITWSDEQTYYRTWGPHAVTTEAITDHVTAITYVSPDKDAPPYETFWDAATLSMASPPDGRLPAPESLGSDGFITNVVSTTLLNHLVVEWETPVPASTQAWYRVVSLSTTTTLTGSERVYIPLALRNSGEPSVADTFTQTTIASQTPVTYHVAWLGPFTSEETVEFVLLSRRLDGDTCRTSASEIKTATVGPIIVLNKVYLPMVIRP